MKIMVYLELCNQLFVYWKAMHKNSSQIDFNNYKIHMFTKKIIESSSFILNTTTIEYLLLFLVT